MDLHLIDACATLLGPQALKKGQGFLRQLDISVIRQAYRRLALAYHPDAALRPGARPGSVDGKRFIEASRAYETLMGYLLKRRSPAPPGTARARPRPAGPTTASGQGSAWGAGASARTTRFYHGPLPGRRLRLAEFLYYSGRVSWQSLIASIVWQRSAKPKFAELARELRTISGRDLLNILRAKRRHEQTGETARRLRLLSAEEVERILRLQRARHKPIGRYFVENERMASAELARIVGELFRHNARWERE